MPITYECNDQRRLITVTVTEPYSVTDILGVIDRQAAEGAWGHATLYDLRGMRDMSPKIDLEQMADRVRAVAAGCERGPVGIAINPRPALFLAFLTYAHLTKELMAVEVLLTASQLNAWVARNVRGGSSPAVEPT